MGFHLIEFILICDKKFLQAKANTGSQFYLHFWGAVLHTYTYMWTLSFLMYGHQ